MFYLTATLATGYAQFTFGYGQPGRAGSRWWAIGRERAADGRGLYDPSTSRFYLTSSLVDGRYRGTPSGYAAAPWAGWALVGTGACEPGVDDGSPRIAAGCLESGPASNAVLRTRWRRRLPAESQCWTRAAADSLFGSTDDDSLSDASTPSRHGRPVTVPPGTALELPTPRFVPSCSSGRPARVIDRAILVGLRPPAQRQADHRAQDHLSSSAPTTGLNSTGTAFPLGDSQPWQNAILFDRLRRCSFQQRRSLIGIRTAARLVGSSSD